MLIKTLLLTPMLFWSLSLASPASAQDYEMELRSVASKLAAQLQVAGQKSGTVLDFTDLQGPATELGRFLAQEVSDHLVGASKTVSFIDRANLQYLLRENKLSMEGLISPETSRKLGNMIGIDTVIYGTVIPLGKTLKLSIRGVAVETGKIVASQSTTLPAVPELGELYARGVAGGPQTLTPTMSSTPAPRDIRAMFGANAIKMNPGQATVGYADIGATFSIENRSGMPIGLGLVQNSTSLGACLVMDIRGIGYFDQSQIQQIRAQPDPQRNLHYLPPNGKVSIAAVFGRFGCAVGQGMTVDLTTSLIVAAEKEVMILPANTSIQVLPANPGIQVR